MSGVWNWESLSIYTNFWASKNTKDIFVQIDLVVVLVRRERVRRPSILMICLMVKCSTSQL